MPIWPVIALVFAQAQASPGKDFSPVEVLSADGACLARIDRAAGQEAVAANMARFALTVFAVSGPDTRRELWQAPYPFDGSAARYVLANRGRAFVELEEHFSESHTVLRIHAAGREAVKWSGVELSIPRETLGGTNLNRSWLDEGRAPDIGWTDGAFGPCLELDIPCRGGLVRRIDLEHVRIVDPQAGPLTPRVEPAVQGTLPTRSAIPYVQSVEFAPAVRAGRGFELQILANHATPGWRFLGFELESADGRLILTPRSEAPDGFAPQVLTVFRVSAQLIDVPVGRYRLDVSGWRHEGVAPTIDVLPEHLLAGLRTSGGFAGIEQFNELHEQGVMRRILSRDAASLYLELPGERMDRLLRLIAALPAKSRRAETRDAADLFQHTLGFWSDEKWITIEVDDLAATDAERELIGALRED